MAFPPNSIFLDRLVCYLMPYFLPMTTDIELARAEILETLAAYATRTRAELLNAVQIIAFSMSALDMLLEAKLDTDFSPSMRLRFRGCANNLNRSSQAAEKVLVSRLECDLLEPSGKPAEPVDDMTDVQIQEALRQTKAKIDTTRNRLANAHPMPLDPSKRPRTGALFNTIFDTAAPPRTAAA